MDDDEMEGDFQVDGGRMRGRARSGCSGYVEYPTHPDLGVCLYTGYARGRKHVACGAPADVTWAVHERSVRCGIRGHEG